MLRRPLVLLLIFFCASTALAQQESRFITDQQGAPVKWMPWGDAAFARAKREQKPVYAFVGFFGSWPARKMLREAFLNGEIAEMMNAYFVPVLLDAHSRPDVARLYESYAGTSDLPLNVLLTPDGKPFEIFGAAEPSEVSRRIVIVANRWKDERAALVTIANEVKAKPIATPLTTTHASLLAAQLRAGDKEAAAALRNLTASTMHDFLGGGFHRAKGQFEKTLSDQALLAMAYLDAWQLTGDEEMQLMARSVLEYALRDLKLPDSAAFNAGQDSASLIPGQGPVFVNGAFYTWSPEEVELLVHDEAPQVMRVLAEPRPADLRAKAEALQKLLEVRQRRPAPFRDDQVLAGWNGLMISALARAGAVLHEQRFTDAARDAATAVMTKLWNGQTKTLSRKTGVEALPEDYTLVVQALLDLFDATYDIRWLELALTLQQRQDALFWRETRYVGKIDNAPADEPLPDANGIAAMNLLRIANVTASPAWRARADAIIDALPSLPSVAAAKKVSESTGERVVVTGNRGLESTNDLLAEAHSKYAPLRAVIYLPPGADARARIARTLPWTKAVDASAKEPRMVTMR